MALHIQQSSPRLVCGVHHRFVHLGMRVVARPQLCSVLRVAYLSRTGKGIGNATMLCKNSPMGLPAHDGASHCRQIKLGPTLDVWFGSAGAFVLPFFRCFPLPPLRALFPFPTARLGGFGAGHAESLVM